MEKGMTALDISDVYFKLAAKASDTRWKRYLLEIARAFQEEWLSNRKI